jgi:DNA (cytosine-5)-methyltransferase 1
MTSKRPYIVLDDDDDESRSNYGSDMELLDYDSESDLEIIAIEPRKAYVTPPKATANSGKAPSSDAIALPDVRIQRYKLGTGTAIAPGDTVELKDHLTREPNAMHSGDFLRIKFIIKNLQTDEVRLRGYRMRRTKYFGQIFDCKCDRPLLEMHTDL